MSRTPAVCRADNCERPVYARALCGRHYKQEQRHGHVLPDPVPRDCAVPECGREAVTRGWCHGHYLRWSRTGDVRAGLALQRPTPKTCNVEGCVRPAHAQGLCRTHLERQRVHGSVRADVPIREITREGWSSHGYWCVRVPPELQDMLGIGGIGEHRLVMSIRLGRALHPDEVVHHKNGDRLDNRPSNLELWSTAQPKGQRTHDKLWFAYEMIRRYDSEGAAALGLDSDAVAESISETAALSPK